MKSIWIIVSTLALANLLALLGLGAWLKATDRLSMDRIRAVREVFAQTTTDEATAEGALEAEAQRSQAEADEQAKQASPPLSAEGALNADDLETEKARQHVERLRREVADLQRSLLRERAALDDGWAQFRAEKQAFEEMRVRLAALEGGEQFERTLRLYEALKPKQAQDLLQQLIDAGDTEQAVSYLNAMQTRTASRIIAEFEDPAVAADLLERLRTRGLEARAAAAASSE